MDRTTDLELGGYNESSVAISPVDPDIIAYASLYEMRVSTDGGSTFGPAIQPEWPPTHYAAGDPVVAFDADGRLFWIYLGWTVYDRFLDVFLVQCDPTTGTVLPGYPTNLTALSGLPGPDGHLHDKAWLAIDNWDGSPHRNNIYVAWTDFPSANSNTDVYFSRSTDQGMTWSAVPVVSSSEFTWPTHVAVAPNGDVYCAYHVMGDNWWNRGQVRLFRSTDGGVSLVQTAQPYAQGNAVVNLNIQTRTYPIPGAKFWMQGCFQPWVLPDPVTPGVVSVVVNDDPDDYRWDDPGDVHLVRSTDSGATWSGVVRVDDGPGESHQAMPAASIDRITGNIAVTWYDNRSGAVNAQGDYLLDTFAAVSLDGGLTFEPDFQINDEAFDPDLGASCRLDCGDNHYGVW
ncbi:MAG: glycoside hydrolase, partial [Phycisphaerales bacterium]|nr:glycoside hydrolase [Phycisphaerales bacterium]